MDIKSVYLNGVISKDIYMCQPKGYKEKGEEGKVAKLKKGLYGLKQAGREWYATLHDFLIQLGFTWMHAGHSIFIYQWGTSTIVIPVYIDDKLLAGNDDSLLDSVQHSIGTHFKTSNLGMASWILSIHIQHNIMAGTLFIDQCQYIKGVLLRLEMSDCTPINIPLPAGIQFGPATSDDHTSVSSYPYLEVIRSLMYTVLGTHLDICSAVRALAPFAATFGHKHVNGLKHIMKYLSRMKNWGIMYTMSESSLVGYTNVDWANDHSNQQSILGYTFLYSGGAVSWMSRQQMTVADSSTHTEYIAAAEALKELMWLHRLLTELKEGVPGLTPLHINNCATDLLVQNPVNHSTTVRESPLLTHPNSF